MSGLVVDDSESGELMMVEQFLFVPIEFELDLITESLLNQESMEGVEATE
jgi:hypothetical protein